MTRYLVCNNCGHLEPKSGPVGVPACAECGNKWLVIYPAGQRNAAETYAWSVANPFGGENPTYGPGNPDWERDFEKTRDDA